MCTILIGKLLYFINNYLKHQEILCFDQDSNSFQRLLIFFIVGDLPIDPIFCTRTNNPKKTWSYKGTTLSLKILFKLLLSGRQKNKLKINEGECCCFFIKQYLPITLQQFYISFCLWSSIINDTNKEQKKYWNPITYFLVKTVSVSFPLLPASM